MMIDKIITDYLSNHKRLVIPQFGAFLKKDNSSITFVEFLKQDDGVLTSIVSVGMGVSSSEAMSIIDNFLKSVRAQIGSDGSYTIKGVGQLTRDGNGLYTLKSSISKLSDASQPKPAPVQQPRAEMPQFRNIANGDDVESSVVKVTKNILKSSADRSLVDTNSAKPVVRSVVKPATKPVTKPATEKYPAQKVRGKKSMDVIMLIAIITAAIALSVLIYGAVVSNEMPSFDFQTETQVEVTEPIEGSES